MKRTLAALAAGTLAGGLVAGSLAANTLATAATTAAATPSAAAAAPGRGPVAFGLTARGKLVKFSVSRPGDTDRVGRIRGLRSGDRLVGIDIRPANGKLYGVGRDGGVYTIGKRSARATWVADLSADLTGDSFGVDVNPAADALRIIGNDGQNLRFAFATATTTVDATLNVPDTDPQVTGMVGAAYTNNDNSTASGTALYDLNAETDGIALQVPANAGIITPQGPTGKGVPLWSGFDIYSPIRGGVAVGNHGYAVFATGSGATLHRVDITSGRAERVGRLGHKVVDLAVRPAG